MDISELVVPNFSLPPLNIAVLASGNGTNFQAVIEAIIAKKLHAYLRCLVCNVEGAGVLTRARNFRVPEIIVDHRAYDKNRESFEKDIICRLQPYGSIDLVVLAGWMRILSPYFVSYYNGRIINIHPALLPDFKGNNAAHDALVAGINKTGCTTHIVSDEVDGGEILLQTEVPIFEGDTVESLHQRIHEQEYPLMIETINLMHNRIYNVC